MPLHLFARCVRDWDDTRSAIANGSANDQPPGLESDLEYVLTHAFDYGPGTQGYWCDGVTIEGAERWDSGAALLKGKAVLALGSGPWCRVPIAAEMICDPSSMLLQRILLNVGAASLGSLAAHEHVEDPTAPPWLLCFEVPRPGETPLPNAAALFDQVETWSRAHPGRPIVGPEWTPMTLPEVLAYLESAVTAGVALHTEDTWLDGGEALRIV